MKLSKRIFSLILVFVGVSTVVSGQDFHFSQFYSTPTLINPSNTGNLANDYRVGVINKSHLFDKSNQYQTIAAFADVAILEDQIARNSWLGLGINFMHDNAGQGNLRTIRTGGSIAFHKAVISDQLFFSMGMDFNFVRKQLDLSSIYFNDQIGADGLDLTMISEENFDQNTFNYLDVSGGINLSYVMGKLLKVNFGLGMLHLNRPSETVYFRSNNSGYNKRTVRPVITLNTELQFGKFGIQPGVLYTRDKGAQELIVGSHFVFILSEQTRDSYGARFLLGAWYRLKESIVPSAGMEIENFRFMISYDANLDLIRNGAPDRKGFEVSLIHSGRIWPRKNRLNCPRF